MAEKEPLLHDSLLKLYPYRVKIDYAQDAINKNIELFGNLIETRLISGLAFDCCERWTWLFTGDLYIFFKSATDATQCKLQFG